MHRTCQTVPTRTPFVRVAVLLAALALPACSDDSPVEPEVDEPEVSQPTVAEVPVAELPVFDTELYKTSCSTPNSGVRACPVIRWDGVDYVALSFRDNRLSFAIHAWDTAGGLRSVQEFRGARYLAAVEIDTTAETVGFVGQDERTVTLTWAELEAMR